MQKESGSGGIRTHDPEETATWKQRLRPLGHTSNCWCSGDSAKCWFYTSSDFHSFHFQRLSLIELNVISNKTILEDKTNTTDNRNERSSYAAA